MRHSRLRKSLITFLSFLFMALVWQLIAMSIDTPRLFPGLWTLVHRILSLVSDTDFWQVISVTIFRGIWGGLIAFLLALLFSVCMNRYLWFRYFLRPILSFFRSIPVISFILLFLIWFKSEHIPVIMAIITMTPVITENLTEGMLHLNRSWREMTKVYHLGFYLTFCHVVYPTIKPYLFSGLITASGLGWKAIIIGEALAQPALGIGTAIKEAQNFIEIPSLIAWTIIAVLFSFAWETVLRYVQKQRFKCVGKVDERKRLEITTSPTENIALKNISFSYSGKPVFTDATFEFPLHSIYCIMGQSGRGKSTLLHIIGALLKVQKGEVKPTDRVVSLVAQESQLLPHLTVLQNVMLPLHRLYPYAQAEEIARESLRQMHAEMFADTYPLKLSGGEKQRVSLARAIAFPAHIWLFDEPFSGLDAKMKKEILKTLVEMCRKKNITFIFVTHQCEDMTDADFILQL